MTYSIRSLGLLSFCVGLMVVAPRAATAGDTSASSGAAHGLVALMSTHHLDAIAAPDPADTSRFIAALLVNGGPLLVVSAATPSGGAIAARIASGAYRDVYLDLQGTPTPAGKFFVQDAGADGIRDGQNGIVDVVYEDGTRQTLFDRGLAKTLRGDAYDKALTAADRRYAHMLNSLADAIRAMPAATVSGR